MFIWNACHKLITADYYPLYHDKKMRAHGNIKSPLDDMAFIHLNASRALFGQRHFLIQYLAKFLLVITWPVRLFKLTFKLIGRHGKHIEFVTGKKQFIQIFEVLSLSLFCNIPPKAYCLYQLYLTQKKHRASNYIFSHEVSPLFNELNNHARNKAIDNKKAFSLACKQYQLPVAPTLGEFTSGHFVNLKNQTIAKEDIERQLIGDVFIKPSVGSQGKEAMLWCNIGNGKYRNDGNTILTIRELVDYYSLRSINRSYLLQTRLLTHPFLSDISSRAICTLRITTLRCDDGTITHLLSALKIPYVNKNTNNIGYLCAVDENTGELGRLYSYRTLCNGFDNHPQLDISVQGRILPDWPKALAVALRAHSYFPEYFSLGWDVALTSSGPVLLEANSGWDVLTIQRAHQKALGETSFKTQCVSRLTSFSK